MANNGPPRPRVHNPTNVRPVGQRQPAEPPTEPQPAEPIPELTLVNPIGDDHECPICYEALNLRIVADCNCRQVCCQRCFFSFIQTEATAANGLRCFYCRQRITTVNFNIKSDSDYRTWAITHPSEGPTYYLIRVSDLHLLL